MNKKASASKIHKGKDGTAAFAKKNGLKISKKLPPSFYSKTEKRIKKVM